MDLYVVVGISISHLIFYFRICKLEMEENNNQGDIESNEKSMTDLAVIIIKKEINKVAYFKSPYANCDHSGGGCSIWHICEYRCLIDLFRTFKFPF